MPLASNLRYVLSALIAMLAIGVASAQNDINVTVQLIPPYSPYLSDYVGPDTKMIVTLQNTTASALDVRFVGSVEGDNGVKITIPDAAKANFPISVPANGMTTIFGKDLEGYLDPDKLQLSGIAKTELIVGNGLLEGNYTLCLQAKEFNGNKVLSKASPFGCAAFAINHAEPPMTLQPVCASTALATNPQNLVFSWTVPAGVQPAQIEYELTVVEAVPQHANANQAILSATNPVFFRTVTQVPTYLFSMADPKLELGRRYAWRVQARPKQGVNNVFFKNKGFSVACDFTYGNANDQQNNQWQQDNQGGPCSNKPCAPAPAPKAVASNVTYKDGDSVKIGYFTLVLNGVSSGSAQNLSGMGYVRAPFLRVNLRTSFTGLKVNDKHEVYDGTAIGSLDPGLIVEEKLKNYTDQVDKLGQNVADKVSDITQYVKSAQKMLPENIDVNLAGKPPVALPLGMSKQVNNALQIVNIVSVEFSPSGAKLNAFFDMKLPEANNKTVAFGIKNVCFHPMGLALGDVQKLTMIGGDYTFPWGQQAKLTLKSAINNNGGTFVTWNCDGFQGLQVDGFVEFDEALLVKKQGPGKVRATFLAQASSWADVLATATIDEFGFPGMKGLDVKASNVVVDFSDVRNAESWTYPAAWNGEKNNTWRGVAIGKLEVTLPPYLRKNKQPIVLEMSNALISKQGFTGAVKVSNLVQGGSLGGWKFSMDEVEVALLNNSFTKAGFAGQLTLPISDNTSLGYSATFACSNNGVTTNVSVELKNDVKADLWMATMNIKNGSKVSVEASGDDVALTAVLNGDISIQGQMPDLGNLSVNMPSIAFQNFTLSNKKPYIVDGSFTFASPQKSLGGFPLNIEKGAPVQVVFDNQNDPGKVGLRMGIGVGLDGNGALAIGGNTVFTVWGKRQESGGFLTWKPDKPQLNEISINAETPAVSIEGSITFFNGNGDYGTGFRGAIKATFQPKMQVAAVVMFGKKDDYRYWFVDAMVKLPTAIPVTTGFGFWGFGGGAYFNMARQSELPGGGGIEDAGNPDVNNAKNTVNNLPTGASLSGIIYKPKAPDKQKGSIFGFQAKVLMGTMPTPDMFNGDITIEAVFYTNGGLEYIGLTGNGYFFSVPNAKARPSDPILAASASFYFYNSPNKRFEGKISCALNLPPPKGSLLKGGGEAHIYFAADKWYIKFGTPQTPFGMQMLKGVASASAYFMCGKNGLPPPPPLPAEFASLEAMLKQPTRDESIGETGTGFAFGTQVKIGGDKYKFLIFYAQFGLTLGFDLAVMKNDYECTNSHGKVGLNGWVADGQAYASIIGAVGLSLNLWFIKADVELFKVEAKAALMATVPNPNWFAGAVQGSYSLFGGLINGSMQFKFETGEKCKIKQADPFEGLKVIADLGPKGKTVDCFTYPEVAFNLAVGNKTMATDGPQMAVVVMDDKNKEVIKRFRFGIERCKLFVESSKNVWTEVPSTVSLENDKYVAMVQPGGSSPQMLAPETRHKLVVWVYGVLQNANGTWSKIPTAEGKNDVYFEKDSVIFTTKKAPENIVPSNVMDTYPRRMARYLYRNEATTGFVRFKAFPSNIPTFKPEDASFEYRYRARWFEVGGGADKIHESPIAWAAGQSRMTYDVPTDKLKPEKIYVVQFVRAMVSKNMANNMNQMQLKSNDKTSMQASMQQIGDNALRTYRRKLTAARLGEGEMMMYQLAFRTSKHATFEQKIGAYLNGKRTSKKAIHHTITSEFEGQEAFDWAELNPTYVQLSKSVTAMVDPPLLVQMLDQPSNSEGWWKAFNDEYRKPLAKVANLLRTTNGNFNQRLYRHSMLYGKEPNETKLKKSIIIDGFFPGLASWWEYDGNGRQDKLTNEEINAVFWKDLDEPKPGNGLQLVASPPKAKPVQQGPGNLKMAEHHKLSLHTNVSRQLWQDIEDLYQVYYHDSRGSSPDKSQWDQQWVKDANKNTNTQFGWLRAIWAGSSNFDDQSDAYNPNYKQQKVRFPMDLRYTRTSTGSVITRTVTLEQN